MSWLTEPPESKPPEPGHVNLVGLMGAISAQEVAGTSTPAGSYLRAHAPKLEVDRYGQPIPLSAVDQDRLDRMFAVLAAPYDRTRALMVSGLLSPDEVDAVKATFPEVYSVLVNQATREIMESDPPWRVWAETTVGILIGMPAAQIYGGTPEKQEGPAPGPPKRGKVETQSQATQADRREIAVRAEH